MVSMEFPLRDSTYTSCMRGMTYPEAGVVLEALDLLDVVAVEVEVLEEPVAVGALNLVDGVARVVDPLEVGGWLEVEGPPDLVPRCRQFDQVLQVGQVLEVDELVVGHVHILQVLVFIDALYLLFCKAVTYHNGDQVIVRNVQIKVDMAAVVE